MAEIELRRIEKSYGETAVVRGVSLSIRNGEFLTLVGPSGCGKSTLLRIVAGLEAQDSGDVVVGGRCVNDRRPKERDVAMVFQSYALYPHLSVFDNLALPLRTRRLSFAQRLPFVGRALPGRGDVEKRFAPKSSRQHRRSTSPICCTASRASFPAVSASASRSAARWCGIPPCF
jgi:multiple sugar transport system ATP-binding protein